MKITRQEAYEILELEEGADFEQVKKAYRRKGMDWHPDKHPEENREVATVEFQKIGAAFSKLRDDEMSSDDDDYSYSDDDDDDLDDFFAAYMGGHRGGGGGGGGHRGGGGGFGFRSSNGFVYVNVPDFFSFGGPPTGHRARRREQRANPFHHFSSGGGMGFRDKEFYDKLDKEKKQAEEQTEKYKGKAEKERNARQEQERRCRWLEKLGRLTRLSFTDTSIKLSADTKGARTAHFPSYKIPDNFLWEMQYKPASGTGEEYMTLTVKDSMECDVTGLQPGTQYVFRARTGVILDASEGKMEFGDWNVEYKTSTSGVAPKQSASSKPAGATATPAATAGAGVNGNGTGGGRKKAQKKAAAAEKKNVKQEQQVNVDDEAAAAKAAAEKEREERLKAAMEAAAADYAAATGAASTTNKPEKDSLSQQQESNTSTKKKNKKKTTSAAPTPAPSAELPPVDQQRINDKAASLPDSSTTPLSTQTKSTTQPIVLPATLDEPHLPSLLKDWVQANMDTDNEKYNNNDSNSISNHDSTGTDQAVGTANGNMFSALLDDEAPEPKPLNADQAKFENKKKEVNKKEVDTANGEIHRPLFPPPPAAAAAQFQPMPPTTHAAVRGGRGRRGGRGGRGAGRGFSQGVYEKYEHSPSNLPPVPIRASAFAAPPLHAAPPLWEPTPAAPPSRAAPPKRSPAPAAPPTLEPTLAAPPAPPTDVPVRPPPKQRPVKKYVPLTNIPPARVSTAPVIQVQNTQPEQQEQQQQVKEKKKRPKKPKQQENQHQQEDKPQEQQQPQQQQQEPQQPQQAQEQQVKEKTKRPKKTKQQKDQQEDELQVQQQEQHQEQQERQEVEKTLKEKKPRKPKQPKATPARPPPPGLVLHPVTTLPTGTGGAVEAASAPPPSQSEAKIKKKRYRNKNKDKYHNTGTNPNGGAFNASEVNFQPFNALGF